MSLTASQVSKVDELIKASQALPGALLPILHAIQHEMGYVPEQSVRPIAEQLNLSRAEVHGVISFYHFFVSKPQGRHSLQICRAESCQAVGGRELEAHAKATLGIDFHQTSADGNVTLKPVYCLGNCACSPAVRVGDDIYGLMTTDKLDALIDELQTDVLELN
jgi:formate dehydrogenase subunit gamma